MDHRAVKRWGKKRSHTWTTTNGGNHAHARRRHGRRWPARFKTVRRDRARRRFWAVTVIFSKKFQMGQNNVPKKVEFGRRDVKDNRRRRGGGAPKSKNRPAHGEPKPSSLRSGRHAPPGGRGVGQFRVDRRVSLPWTGGSVCRGHVGQFAWNTHRFFRD